VILNSQLAPQQAFLNLTGETVLFLVFPSSQLSMAKLKQANSSSKLMTCFGKNFKQKNQLFIGFLQNQNYFQTSKKLIVND